jgi:hypothetical protein
MVKLKQGVETLNLMVHAWILFFTKLDLVNQIFREPMMLKLLINVIWFDTSFHTCLARLIWEFYFQK